MPLKPPFVSDLALYTAEVTSYEISDFYSYFVQARMNSEDISTMFGSNLTVFAPTREAFTFFNNEDKSRLLEPIWIRHATDFLFNHISIPARTREELHNDGGPDSKIQMLNGRVYQLRRKQGNPRIGTALIPFGDIIGLDG
jgi:uncharacterized surface protein with fasciclin (FAS1) repeats